jgi:hypothetical protein
MGISAGRAWQRAGDGIGGRAPHRHAGHGIGGRAHLR